LIFTTTMLSESLLLLTDLEAALTYHWLTTAYF
jgi:hypothetical protein